MNDKFQPQQRERFENALRRFDQVNSADPNLVKTPAGPRPREIVYAEWLTEWVLRLCPEASEPLRLAARSQHLCRWAIPRESFPATRAGYLKWRETLKKFHAQKAADILRELGYSADLIQRVQDLNLKRHFPLDPESCVLEDALCLVFLEHQFKELAQKTSDEKMINALQKTWNKMTPSARRYATTLALGDREKELLDKALAAGS